MREYVKSVTFLTHHSYSYLLLELSSKKKLGNYGKYQVLIGSSPCKGTGLASFRL